jgi:hypothetical protein
MSKNARDNRELIAYFSFSILVIIAITTIDWTVTNYYNLALLEALSLDQVRWWFFSYQITIFIITGMLIIFFMLVVRINYVSKELDIELKGFHYFKFLKTIPKKKKFEIFFPPLAFGLLFVFNFEDILWFRLFYGPRMSYVIDNFFGDMWWLDLHISGFLGVAMGFGGAISLSVMIVSSIGYLIFCILWYKLIRDKWLFLNLGICVLYIFGIDIVFGIIGPPLPYLRITLMEIAYLSTFVFIVVRNTK